VGGQPSAEPDKATRRTSITGISIHGEAAGEGSLSSAVLDGCSRPLCLGARRGRHSIEINPVGKFLVRLVWRQGEAEQTPCGTVGNPVHRNLDSNLAFANRLVSMRV